MVAIRVFVEQLRPLGDPRVATALLEGVLELAPPKLAKDMVDVGAASPPRVPNFVSTYRFLERFEKSSAELKCSTVLWSDNIHASSKCLYRAATD